MRGCKRSHCYCVTVLVCRAAADADDAAAYDFVDDDAAAADDLCVDASAHIVIVSLTGVCVCVCVSVSCIGISYRRPRLLLAPDSTLLGCCFSRNLESC